MNRTPHKKTLLDLASRGAQFTVGSYDLSSFFFWQPHLQAAPLQSLPHLHSTLAFPFPLSVPHIPYWTEVENINAVTAVSAISLFIALSVLFSVD